MQAVDAEIDMAALRGERGPPPARALRLIPDRYVGREGVRVAGLSDPSAEISPTQESRTKQRTPATGLLNEKSFLWLFSDTGLSVVLPGYNETN